VGKSLQSLACNLLYREAFPFLIICPSALKHVWRDEVLKWYQNIICSSQIMILKKGSLKPG
jgi:SNF2 family DNA or RNA helicase